MTFGSLFAGIGGFDLGFERAGLTCKWQVEIDEYCRTLLECRWPHVKRWGDVRTFQPDRSEWGVDVICGGFPCQDISTAGKQQGIHGKRSSLFFEYVRLIRTLRPSVVVLENVANLIANGLCCVLGELAAIGYDAEWDCIPAYYFGSPQVRDRVFVIAYPNGRHERNKLCTSNASQEVSQAACDAYHKSQPRYFVNAEMGELQELYSMLWSWPDPPDGLGMADGIPARMDRLRGLGNAVMPHVAEWIGSRILQVERIT